MYLLKEEVAVVSLLVVVITILGLLVNSIVKDNEEREQCKSSCEPYQVTVCGEEVIVCMGPEETYKVIKR